MKKAGFLIFLTFLGFVAFSFSQEVPFDNEVKEINKRIKRDGYQVGSTLFTGSSSIRLWESLQNDFPDYPIINTGFGGSKASDLKRHLYPLVLQFKPSRVFIYEGDNDIQAGLTPEEIINDLEQIVLRIQVVDPGTQIFLISAKPSPSRWDKKENYLKLNEEMKAFCEKKEGVEFVDVWDIMIDEKGEPISSIFIEDQLHMNEDGYELWKKVFGRHFPEK
ncbi:GDSL-type esterase/lipase family protein [Algoriphagus limi]|uniref:GDSL-type esterase/lipase family protein n=1 Tax=Algoriphagus limi TaxID=2975273 RepID=A0ABT2G4R4_9BACT|nr:GDSL-type esterase/lipase family protein [Algoriphagus limi]MCS5490265.1 GDSL-type esterase/lipase family protein [Algoriphagus limi]